jgi:hypothetical protein
VLIHLPYVVIKAAPDISRPVKGVFGVGGGNRLGRRDANPAGRRHNIFVAAALTAVPFGFIHLPLAFLSEISLASVLISLAAFILLSLFLRPLVGVVLRGSRDSLLPPA